MHVNIVSSLYFTLLFSGRLVALDFVMKYIEDRAVQWTAYIIAFLDRRQQMVHRMSG